LYAYAAAVIVVVWRAEDASISENWPRLKVTEIVILTLYE